MNDVTVYDDRDVPRKFAYLSNTSSEVHRFFWSLWYYERNLSLSSLVAKDTGELSNKSLEALLLSFDLKDKCFSPRQRRNLFGYLHHQDVDKFLNLSPMQAWLEAATSRDGRFILDFWITRPALDALQKLNKQEIFDKLKSYVEWIDAEDSEKDYGGLPKHWFLGRKAALGRVAAHLAKAFDPTLDPSERRHFAASRVTTCSKS